MTGGMKTARRSSPASQPSARAVAAASVALTLAGAAVPGGVAGCGGAPAHRPGEGVESALPARFVEALRTEATGDAEEARRKYLAVVTLAANAPEDPWSLPAVRASLDALVHRYVSGLGFISVGAGLADRTRADGARGGGSHPSGGSLAAALEPVASGPGLPVVRGVVASALSTLAEDRGDGAAAARFRAAAGCVQQAVVVGPLAWPLVSGAREATPLDAFDAPLAASYAVPGAFTARAVPVKVQDRGCELDPMTASAVGGVHAVVVDVPIDRPQRISVGFTARTAAALVVGGREVLERRYEQGAGAVTAFATVDVTAGTLRVVARVGAFGSGDPVSLWLWDAQGKPLAWRAPSLGDRGTAKATAHAPMAAPAARTDAERTLAAAAAHAGGDVVAAERAVEPWARKDDAPPEVALVYARAVEQSLDLPEVDRAERARAAYERVLAAWPGAWEAVVAHAELAGQRRGQSEGPSEALRDLDAHKGPAAPSGAAVIDTYDGALSAKEGLFDRAMSALGRARPRMAEAPLFAQAERLATPRVGADRVAVACAAVPWARRASYDCYDALRATGDTKAASEELARLRALMGEPAAYAATALHDALGASDAEAARRAFSALLPGERSLSDTVTVDLRQTRRAPSADALRSLFERSVLTARDAPGGYGALLAFAGDDRAVTFDQRADAAAAADRRAPVLADAATAILAHEERYAISPAGILHGTLFDVRRVGGTTDVEENAQADPPDVDGRALLRVLRRRILKRDGRVLEPERAPDAHQAHADLAQLEKGDVVEAIYETWALPGDTGDLTLDTPDLLPDRTAIHEATVELKIPAGARATLWSHGLLGKAEEKREGAVRTLRWTVRDRPARRIEAGTPKMDGMVCVSMSTATWADVGRALRESLAALDETSPEVSRWARAAAGGEKKAPLDIVARVVEAVGAAVKEASPAELTDAGFGRPRGPQTLTARTVLASRQGSRTWLIARALREAGIASDVVVAESEPFSADPQFPPHFGRFNHPLAVAHLPGASAGAPTTDVWIDADVPGPPLPPGRISPSLRGRSALWADGTIKPVPPPEGDGERDEVDVRLTVDESGNAAGSFTVLLRGREAQEMAEAFARVVGTERQRALRGVVLGWVPFATVDDVALSSSDGSWQIAVRASISVSGFAQREGRGAAGAKGPQFWIGGVDPVHFVFPQPYATTLGASFARQGGRASALAINEALHFHVHRRIVLPKGATVVRSPGPFEVATKALRATRSLAVAGGSFEDDFTLDMPTGTVAPESYLAFVRGAHQTDDAFLSTVRVRMAP